MAVNYPNGGLITETNANYYAGQQSFIIPNPVDLNLVCTFDTKLIGGITPLNNFSVSQSRSPGVGPAVNSITLS